MLLKASYLKRNVKDFLIRIMPRRLAAGHRVIRLQRGVHLTYLISEHTVDFVAHSFVAGHAEMGCDLVCGLADSLHKVGLSGLCGCGNDVFGIHRDSLRAVLIMLRQFGPSCRAAQADIFSKKAEE